MTGGATDLRSRRILHVGCGTEPLPEWLPGQETRLDIEPSFHPDIVASMTEMGEIGPFDIVFSSHCLEHLYPFDVPKALREFLRVLAPGGSAIIFVPDLEGVRPTEDVLYVSPSGPICGLDMFYGLRSALKERPYMAHHTGFIAATLFTALAEAGFEKVSVQRCRGSYNLIAGGAKP